MNRKEVIETITGDRALMSKWRELVKSGEMNSILELCNCFRSPYNKDAKPDPIQHIQNENNGGMKAWDKLEYLLTSLPFNENKDGQSQDQEYVGFVRDHVSKRKQNSYTEEDGN